MWNKASFWLKFSFANLFIVALLGLLMRYKIGFEFPHFDQKNLQLSHSNFAFVGWITHTLMVLMIVALMNKSANLKLDYFKRYNFILIANLICAYGILISFIIMGYGMLSIVFTSLTVLVSVVFAYFYFKDLKSVSNEDLSKNWFKAALFFNIISSAGSFYLGCMMVTKHILQNDYLASMYYYLHFQYNGWFFFACMGFLVSLLELKISEDKFFKRFFYLFFIACIPAYFLSTLWLDLPLWIYILTALAAIVQVFAWFKFLVIVVKTKEQLINKFPTFLKYIFLFAGFALTVKFLLQLGSTIPALSQLAFGFRPIVIAYLHLILLAVISLFLLFYIFGTCLIRLRSSIKIGLITFTIGVFLNELILGIQGAASLSYTSIPYVNEMLFGAAIVLVAGSAIIFFGCFSAVSERKIEQLKL